MYIAHTIFLITLHVCRANVYETLTKLVLVDCCEFALFSGTSDSLLDRIRMLGFVFGPSFVLTNIPSLKSPA